jgi:mannose-1-phosphate guanylyltransferase
MKHRFRTAFILGAGLGTRLKPLTDRCPKPLLDLGDRPVIGHAMDHLLTIGIERFIINTHHLPEVYGERFPDRQWRTVPMLFRYEPVLLETGGGLKNIEDLLKEDEAIICYNGDIVSDLPLQRLVEAHEAARPEATLLLRSNGSSLNVNIDGEGNIVDLRHTLGNRGVRACLFTGIYTVETAFLSHLEQGRVESIITAFLRRIVEKPGSVRGVVVDEGEWRDIGSVEAYETLKEKAATQGCGR